MQRDVGVRIATCTYTYTYNDCQRGRRTKPHDILNAMFACRLHMGASLVSLGARCLPEAANCADASAELGAAEEFVGHVDVVSVSIAVASASGAALMRENSPSSLISLVLRLLACKRNHWVGWVCLEHTGVRCEAGLDKGTAYPHQSAWCQRLSLRVRTAHRQACGRGH